MEVRIPGADPEHAMLAHENGGVRVVNDIAGEPRKLVDDFFCDVGVPLGRDSTPSPGEASRADTNAQTRGALHGFLMTRGWVVTRMNS